MIGIEHLRHFAISDVGRKRSHNQDAFGVALATGDRSDNPSHLFVVADGMGGHAVGEMASKLAVDAIQLACAKRRGADPRDRLREAIAEANATVHQKGKQNPEFKGMGTTATALMLTAAGAFVGHVGDSRCYRIRGQSIEQLSFDHSQLWEYAKKKNARPEDVKKEAPRNVILRSLGPRARVEVDAHGPYPLEPGDCFLLCSDGLCGPVKDVEMGAAVQCFPVEDACRLLVDLANLRGGPDNITVLLVRVADEYAPSRSGNPLGQQVAGWARKAPMALWPGLAGVALAGVGYALRGSAYGMAAAAVGAVGCFVGAWALMLRDRQRAPSTPPKEVEPAPIHRQAACPVDDALIESFAKIESQLRAYALDSDGDFDHAPFERRSSDAEKSAQAGAFADAFRAYAGNVVELCALLRKGHQKKETLIPNWEKEG